MTVICRSTVVRGVREALQEKLKKVDDLKVEERVIQKLAEEIEIAMFGKNFCCLPIKE